MRREPDDYDNMYDSPLEAAIKEQLEAGLSPFPEALLNQKRRKNKYSTLPKRFSDRLQKYPRHVFINVEQNMIFLYRTAQDWVRDIALTRAYYEAPSSKLFDELRDAGMDYEEIKDSYWLYDMKYLDDISKGMNIVIQMEFWSDLQSSGKQLNLIVKVLCQADADGHVGYQIYRVDVETEPTHIKK